MRKLKSINHNKNGGFTLLEVLISLVLIGIAVAGTYIALVGGSFLLRRAENKLTAISLASTRMEEYLAKSYSELEELDSNPEEAIVINNIEFVPNITVKEKWEGDDPATPEREGIPYKKMTVEVFYKEESIRGSVKEKIVRLTNITPYPYIHVEAFYTDDQSSAQTGYTPIPFNIDEVINNPRKFLTSTRKIL